MNQAASTSDLFENSNWLKQKKQNVATYSTQSKKSVIITIIRTWSHGDKVKKFHMYQRTSTACQAVCRKQSTKRRKTSQSAALTLPQSNLNIWGAGKLQRSLYVKILIKIFPAHVTHRRMFLLCECVDESSNSTSYWKFCCTHHMHKAFLQCGFVDGSSNSTSV